MQGLGACLDMIRVSGLRFLRKDVCRGYKGLGEE